MNTGLTVIGSNRLRILKTKVKFSILLKRALVLTLHYPDNQFFNRVSKSFIRLH